MPSKTLAAPCALLAAVVAAPAFAQSAPAGPADEALLDTVIVTGARDPEDPPVVAAARERLSRTPGAVAVVSAESHRDRFAPTLADVLRDVPGVYAQRKWGGDLRLSVRGSGIGNASHNRGTLVAQDGVPFNEADGFGDFQLIDPLLARYTEVYKGGNALRFGGSLMGGAINLVTPTGRTAGESAALRLDGGSDGAQRAHAELAHAGDAWDAFAAVTGTRAEGWRDHADGQSQHASLNLGRRLGDDREVRLLLSGGYVHQQIPGSLTRPQALSDPRAAAPANLALDYQRDMASLRGAVQTRWRLDASTVFEGGAYAVWKDLDHPIFQVVDQQSRNQGLFGRLDWQGQAFGRRADAFAGAWLRAGDLDAKQWANLAGSHGPLRAASYQNARAADLFVEGRWFVTERLTLVAGATLGRAERDYRSVAVPGAPGSFDLSAERAWTWLAPRFGLLWEDADGTQAYANLTRSVEPPNFSALSPTAGGFQPVEPQEAWTAEAGVRGRRGRLAWDLAVYRAALDKELLNYVPDAALGIPAATFNADRTIHQGVEAGLDWRFGPAWRLRQSLTLSDFRYDGDRVYGDNALPVVPPALYRAELRGDFGRGFVAPSVEWAPAGAWVDHANTLRAPGYAVVSLNAGWRAADGVELFADIRNLFDVRWVSSVGTVTDARVASTAVFWPGDGRSAFVGLRLAY